MNVGLSSLNKIGSNYSMKLNDKEILVVEEDEIHNYKLSESEKIKKRLLKESEKKKVDEQRYEKKLSPDEERLIQDLHARDEEVKTHESAHQTAGGGLVGAATYNYQQGPDGKMYAIGGQVSISTGKSSSPEETISNAKKIIASAMAAGSPSPQDFAVATNAKMMEFKAEQKLIKEKQYQKEGLGIYTNEMKDDLRKQGRGVLSPL